MRLFLVLVCVAISVKGFTQVGTLADFKEQLHNCDSLLKIDPKDCYARFNRAAALRGLGRYEESLIDITVVTLECSDEDKSVYYSAARSLQKLKEYPTAIQIYQVLLALPGHEDTADIFFQVGLCYAKMKSNDSAISYYTKAIGVDSKLGIAYYNRGLLWCEAGQTKKGCTDLYSAMQFGIPNASYPYEDYCKQK